jgi:very-short-patch-repair endonuclease
LWELLRGRRLAGAKFRRQHPIGPFVVDFFCADARLVVEADGAPHLRDRARDVARDHWLESLGLTVLRFFNRDVLEHTDEVLRRIRAQLVARRSGPNLDHDA